MDCWTPSRGQNDSGQYYSDKLKSFTRAYSEDLHQHFAFALLTVGFAANTLNLIVLTRRNMRNAINAILSAISVCDLIVMATQPIFIYRLRIETPRNPYCFPEDHPMPWAIYTLFTSCTTNLMHTCSLYLTVLLAFVRLWTLRRMTSGQKLTWANGWTVSLIGFFAALVVMLPHFPSQTILVKTSSNASIVYCHEVHGLTSIPNATYYQPAYSDLAKMDGCKLIRVTFWVTGFLHKSIPCALLGILVTLLIRVIQKAQKRREELLRNTHERRVDSDRTTRMLIVVVAIFLLTELPQGCLSMGVAFFGKDFYYNVYAPLADLSDILSLINSCANFVIYCAMSAAYRDTFRRLFVKQGPVNHLTQLYNYSLKGHSMPPDAETRRLRDVDC